MVAFGISRKDLRIFLEQSLNEKEKKLLLGCYKLQGYTFSSVARRLANNGDSESTVKLVLRRLKNYNLIDFGDLKSKGKPLSLTSLGEKIFQVLRGD